MYTDGATDAVDCSGEVFGEERLGQWAASQARRSPAEAKASLLGELKRFCGGSHQADDLTALFVRYRGI
jgi:sigma-B regulation protein RsbU (phosphoserine phosphatase)